MTLPPAEVLQEDEPTAHEHEQPPPVWWLLAAIAVFALAYWIGGK